MIAALGLIAFGMALGVLLTLGVIWLALVTIAAGVSW